MSTILKTLKKLEEEKSVLDQKIDLKEMALREDAIHSRMSGNGRRLFFLIATMTIGILTFGGTIVYYWGPSFEVSVPSKHIAIKTPTKNIPLPKKLSKTRTFEGVPMDGILSREKEHAAKSERSITLFKQKEGQQPKVSSNFKKVELLIQATPTSTKNSSAALVNTRKGYVPDVKIKGIIFFDKGSSSNHIILTTPSKNNLKLRVGDSVKNAILKSIQPNGVIFLYQDQLIEMDIGQ